MLAKLTPKKAAARLPAERRGHEAAPGAGEASLDGGVCFVGLAVALYAAFCPVIKQTTRSPFAHGAGGLGSKLSLGHRGRSIEDTGEDLDGGKSEAGALWLHLHFSGAAALFFSRKPCEGLFRAELLVNLRRAACTESPAWRYQYGDTRAELLAQSSLHRVDTCTESPAWRYLHRVTSMESPA